MGGEVERDQSLGSEVADCKFKGERKRLSIRQCGRQGMEQGSKSVLVTGLLSGLETLSSTFKVSCTDFVLFGRDQYR